MEQRFLSEYKKLNDRDIVERITATPCDDVAAAFLIYNRYSPLLHKLYLKVFDNDHSWYEDCLSDFYLYLKGKDGGWSKLCRFEWKCGLATWLSRTAYHRFLLIRPVLIGNNTKTISIDNMEEPKNITELPECSIEEHAIRERNILLMEAIGMLEAHEQKFVLLKRLQGYNSKEIATLLQESWERHGIVKYNSKKQVVVPDAAYVDVVSKRAKGNLAAILRRLQ